jgi:hypothetical protein
MGVRRGSNGQADPCTVSSKETAAKLAGRFRSLNRPLAVSAIGRAAAINH